MNKPDITVLISVRNEEDHIAASINSILGQTYGNFELWVMDDGSIDNTWNIIKSIKDSRIKATRFEKNTGMTDRLNWAIPQIKTEFLTRMDSHNIADKTRLEKQRKFMLANSKYMAIGSNFTRVNEAGNVIFKSNFPTDHEIIKNKLMEKNIFKHASMFFRREIYDKVGMYNPYFRLTQDYDFILRAASKYPVGNLPECLITEIYRNKNMTQKHRVRSAWEALCSQWNAITKYNYPVWQSIHFIRGVGFLVKSQILHS